MLEEAAEPPSTRSRTEAKKRYIEKTHIIYGPWRSHYSSGIESSPPDDLLSIQFTWAKTDFVGPLDPFEGTRGKFENIATDTGKSFVNITDGLLHDLASLIDGSTLGIGKLLDLFSAKCDGKISRRQFELKVYQIADKVKTTTKPQWSIRPEFLYLLNSKPC